MSTFSRPILFKNKQKLKKLSLAIGGLTFVDNAVNPATETITLKATFPNKERTLWPGQFVNVVLILTTKPNATVIPSQAVQTGQMGTYVFVVRQNMTVDIRPVVTGISYNGEVVIEKGVIAQNPVDFKQLNAN